MEVKYCSWPRRGSEKYENVGRGNVVLNPGGGKKRCSTEWGKTRCWKTVGFIFFQGRERVSEYPTVRKGLPGLEKAKVLRNRTENAQFIWKEERETTKAGWAASGIAGVSGATNVRSPCLWSLSSLRIADVIRWEWRSWGWGRSGGIGRTEVSRCLGVLEPEQWLWPYSWATQEAKTELEDSVNKPVPTSLRQVNR